MRANHAWAQRLPMATFRSQKHSPHIGSGDHLSRLMMGVEAAECIASLRHGKWPNGAVVNAEIQDGWTW